MRARSIRLLAAGVACAAATPALPASAAPPRSTAVGVDAREFRLAVYRPRIPTGEVRFNLENLGEDTHDLVVRSASGRVLARSAEARPGARIVLKTTLRSGRYRLSCDVADHAARGMRSTLTAVRPRG